MIGRVLVIAGSDSGGGAGIQADIKTITVLGSYAATAITALTAQNTVGVHGIFDVDPNFIARQIEVVLDDIGADVIKIGMLSNSGVIDKVAEVLKNKAKDIPIILDPVMVAKGGAPLLHLDAISILKQKLIPISYIITPNIEEAKILADMDIKNLDNMKIAAKKIRDLSVSNVLLKGGHLDGDDIYDILLVDDNIQVFESERINTRNTHGTGCTLASAIATFISQKLPLVEAVSKARDYVRKAIISAPNIGKGHGPLGHKV